MENIEIKIGKLSNEDRTRFGEVVNDCIGDTSWLREYGINISNPDLMAVQEILYNQMFSQT